MIKQCNSVSMTVFLLPTESPHPIEAVCCAPNDDDDDDDATPAFGNPPLDGEAFAAAMIMENSLEFRPNEGRGVRFTNPYPIWC